MCWGTPPVERTDDYPAVSAYGVGNSASLAGRSQILRTTVHPPTRSCRIPRKPTRSADHNAPVRAHRCCVRTGSTQGRKQLEPLFAPSSRSASAAESYLAHNYTSVRRQPVCRRRKVRIPRADPLRQSADPPICYAISFPREGSAVVGHGVDRRWPPIESHQRNDPAIEPCDAPLNSGRVVCSSKDDAAVSRHAVRLARSAAQRSQIGHDSVLQTECATET